MRKSQPPARLDAAAAQERANAVRPPEREPLAGRVLTEAEWLNPALGRKPEGR